jgi:RNA polymerase sigma-70 factor (ECF subfamily)
VTSDPELLARVQAGDRDAFEALWARHRGAVRRRLLGMLRDAALAEDLEQETFYRLWTRAAQYDGRGTVGGWLGRIATNLALNALRSARRRRRAPLAPPGPAGDEDEADRIPGWMIDASAAAPDEVFERAERIDRLRRAMAELSEAKREVLRLVHEEDLRVRDAADRLGIPEGTAKSRLHHAMRALADRLDTSDRT